MPVKELEKFREKFPQYSDLADEVLAIRLAAKYSQYEDLPKKVKVARIAEEPNRFVRAGLETEQKIEERPSRIKTFGRQAIPYIQQAIQDPSRFLRRQTNPLTQMADLLPLAASGIGAGEEAVESIPANIGLALQRGDVSQLPQQLGQSLMGQRPAQLGDIARASAIPGLSAEPVASVVGLAASLAPIGGQVGRAVEAIPQGLRSLLKLAQRSPSTMSELATYPEAKVSGLPQEVRQMYLRQRRAELQTVSHEAKIELNRMHRQTVTELDQQTNALTGQLRDESYQAALRLKQVDAKPLLRAQSDRYAQLTNDAVDKSPGVVFRPSELKQVLEKTFPGEENAKAYTMAYEQLRMEGLATDPVKVFTPREILNSVDSIGTGVQRSPTQVYGFEDSVKDKLRAALLDEMERKGVKTSWIREAKGGWAKWKPVQKRLVRDTRLFEESEQVSDTFVNNLMKHAMSDETKGNEVFFQSLQKYLGRDLADPMRPTVARLSLVDRKRVAMEAAQLAEMERIQLQQAGGSVGLRNLELQVNMRVARAKRIWAVIGGLGVIGGGLYGIKQAREALPP